MPRDEVVEIFTLWPNPGCFSAESPSASAFASVRYAVSAEGEDVRRVGAAARCAVGLLRVR